MVKPGGTGRPRLAISARLAPLPPSKSRRPALPSALPSPKVNTPLPDFAEWRARLQRAAGPVVGGLAWSFWGEESGGAVFARAGADDLVFVSIFLALPRA